MRIDGEEVRSDRPPVGGTSVCWITGAGSGLGRALALRMARQGWTVAASARTEHTLRAVADSAPAGRIVQYPLDITDDVAIRQTVARIESELGPISIAILNAGTHIPVHAAALDPATFRALAETNLLGTVACLAAVLDAMRRRRCGRIAIVASVAGYRGLPTAAAYGMTKAGLINLAEALVPELARDGVRLQIVNPGFVRTPLTDRNRFAMPFLMEAADAAEALFRGLSKRRFEIAFPWPFVMLMKLYRLLPYAVSLAVARCLVPREGSQDR